MFSCILTHVLSFLLNLTVTARMSEHQKDLELLLLRQQVRILQRTRKRPPRISRGEKLSLALLAAAFIRRARGTQIQLADSVLMFKPDTLLKWHRELVRRTWTFRRRQPVGRPAITAELEVLILRLARENPRWGYSKIHGELMKLGYTLGRSTIRAVLKRHRLPPASQRARHDSNWRAFLGHYREQILACDFFTVETVWLKTIYVLVFIELGTRRVHFAGCTTNPTAAWVTQHARQISWELQDRAEATRFLIHDRDTKFPAAFDTVFVAESTIIIRTPYPAPNANAFAERWVRSVRQECLDRLLILNEGHLRRVLIAYLAYYNHARPHQGLDQQCPVPLLRSAARDGPIERRDILGGVLHDYYRHAA